MRATNGNAAIEWHDSQVDLVEQLGEDCLLTLTAYVHRSEGEPGVAAGSGWSQRAHLRILRARVEGTVPPLPLTIATGRLTAGASALVNLVPVPSVFREPVRLELVGEGAESLVVLGEAAEVALVGEARYLDEFPG
jgi:hypothetical protein